MIVSPFVWGGNSGTTICADINNDGWFDLLTTEIVHWDVGDSSDRSELLLNSGQDLQFERPGAAVTGIGWEHNLVDWNDGDITAAVFDADNDGLADLYIGSTDYPDTRGHLFLQTEPSVFEELPFELGIDHKRSHGVAVADFDRDGDLDVVVGHSPGRCGGECYESFSVRFFENQRDQQSNSIQLLLEGVTANARAIGARVEVVTGSVTQTQQLDGGFGHYGAQNDFWLHFGLGEHCSAEVIVYWPDGDAEQSESYTLSSNGRYLLRQGDVHHLVGGFTVD